MIPDEPDFKWCPLGWVIINGVKAPGNSLQQKTI
jgi:hypothetical protein